MKKRAEYKINMFIFYSRAEVLPKSDRLMYKNKLYGKYKTKKQLPFGNCLYCVRYDKKYAC
jgi:hypothetical protein